MTLDKLSQMFAIATADISESSTNLYEWLHDDYGRVPKHKYTEEVHNELKRFNSEVRNHLDLIRTSIREYEETNK